VADLGILFLPSGPGLSSGPAEVFLTEVLSSQGQVAFWSESLAPRAFESGKTSEVLWDTLFESIGVSARGLPNDIVIVAESFGSLLAEEFVNRSEAFLRTGQKIRGLLYSPPVMDLREAYRIILKRAGETEAIAGASIDLSSPAFLAALDRAMAVPSILPGYFRRPESFAKWAGGFAEAGKVPNVEFRNLILNAIQSLNLPTKMNFSSKLPTWICVGDDDPYRPSRPQPDLGHVKWVSFEGSAHFPFVDEPNRWRSEIFLPFLAEIKSHLD
jgi:pimeloyl-ACP methyl ester carboxylesterase